MTTAEKLVQISENEQKIYDKGFEDGKAQGGGDDNYYDTFWDNFQSNGNRTNYANAFYGEGWTNENYNPKYPITIGNGLSVFDGCKITKPINIDTSKATTLTYIFRNCKDVESIGKIDCSKCKDLNRLFYDCRVTTVEELVVHEELTYTNTFDYATITNITISGTIAKNGFSLTSSVLSKASIKSIFDALANKTEDTSGTEWLITIGSTNIEKLTEEELEVARRKGWQVN